MKKRKVKRLSPPRREATAKNDRFAALRTLNDPMSATVQNAVEAFEASIDADIIREALSLSPRTGLTVEKLRKARNILYGVASEPRRRRK